MRCKWGVSVAAVLLAACEAPPVQHTHPHFSMAGPMAREWRETLMNNEWQNRTLSELVLARGQPVLVMQIPGGGNPPSFVVVFGTDPATGCIDAFAVSHDADPRIRIYHCR